MWQPNRAQWIVICATAALVVLAWPPNRGNGSNLATKLIHWAVDPGATLPAFPPPLPPGLGDDGDAVAAHDAREAEYFQRYNSSSLTKWRMNVKASRDPFDPTTERQVLVAAGVAGILIAWRLGKTR